MHAMFVGHRPTNIRSRRNSVINIETELKQIFFQIRPYSYMSNNSNICISPNNPTNWRLEKIFVIGLYNTTKHQRHVKNCLFKKDTINNNINRWFTVYPIQTNLKPATFRKWENSLPTMLSSSLPQPSIISLLSTTLHIGSCHGDLLW